jgi:hypothetical protein
MAPQMLAYFDGGFFALIADTVQYSDNMHMRKGFAKLSVHYSIVVYSFSINSFECITSSVTTQFTN